MGGRPLYATFTTELHKTGTTTAFRDLSSRLSCPIALHCKSGRRSRSPADVLEANGFTQVIDVLGVKQWKDEGAVLVHSPFRAATCGSCTPVATQSPTSTPTLTAKESSSATAPLGGSSCVPHDALMITISQSCNGGRSRSGEYQTR